MGLHEKYYELGGEALATHRRNSGTHIDEFATPCENPSVRISLEQRRARLGLRHRLATAARTDDVLAITDSMVALHATDPSTVYLAAAARMRQPAIEPTTDALITARSLVRHHGMRRTVWVYTVPVARAVHAACTIDIARKEWQQLEKWVAASGIDDPAGYLAAARADTLAAIHRLGPTGARALGKAVPALTTKIMVGAGKYTVEQSLHTRVIQNLGFDAAIVRTSPSGGWTSSEYTWSVMTDWLPDGIVGADPIASRDELVARYVGAFGPVSTADVQWWTGLTMGAAKAGLAAADAVEVELHDGSPGWLLPDDLAPVEEPDPWVGLLPSLDPTAMGWKGRGWYLGEFTEFGGPLFDRNGNVGPTVWSNGEVVGGWAQRDGAIVVELLVPVSARTRTAISAATDEWQALIGNTKVTPRFPTPLQRELARG